MAKEKLFTAGPAITLRIEPVNVLPVQANAFQTKITTSIACNNDMKEVMHNLATTFGHLPDKETLLHHMLAFGDGFNSIVVNYSKQISYSNGLYLSQFESKLSPMVSPRAMDPFNPPEKDPNVIDFGKRAKEAPALIDFIREAVAFAELTNPDAPLFGVTLRAGLETSNVQARINEGSQSLLTVCAPGDMPRVL